VFSVPSFTVSLDTSTEGRKMGLPRVVVSVRYSLWILAKLVLLADV